MSVAASQPPKINKPARKKTKTIRQVEIDADREAMFLGQYDERSDTISGADERKIVKAVCKAEAYDLKGLYAKLLLDHPNSQLFSDEVIRFSPNGKECFVFDMGAFVAWDMEPGDFQTLFEQFKTFEINPTAEAEFDEIHFAVNKEKDLSSFQDHHEPIVIIGANQSAQNIYLDQLAFSHGIANSVKLSVLENQLDLFVDGIKHLPTTLALGQKIKLTRTEALGKLGELLQFRAVLNLHSGIVETPDLYWNYHKLEGHFHAISAEFDIKQRVDALNKKLDYAKDITELLKDYLTQRHSLSLEWAIVLLITVEVGFDLLHFAERFYA